MCSSALCVSPRPPAHVTALGPLAMVAHERAKDLRQRPSERQLRQRRVRSSREGAPPGLRAMPGSLKDPLMSPGRALHLPCSGIFSAANLVFLLLCCAVSPDLLSSASHRQASPCPRKPSCCGCYFDWRGPILSH